MFVKTFVFFNKKLILNAVDRARRPVLERQGALIRGIARRGIRKTKGPSAPGRVFHSHDERSRMIFFGWDASSKTVVVGQQRLGHTGEPHTLEFGGRVRVPVRRGKRKYFVVANQAPRPYMRPALAIAKSKLAGEWRGAVRG